MKSYLYKMDCLTNMHVGSGDINYGIVDNEVEKDDVLQCPIIHSSGLKGALRDHIEALVADKEKVKKLFGAPATETEKKGSPGAIKFMDAYLLSRPLRIVGSQHAYVQVTTVSLLDHFLDLCSNFGCMPAGVTLSKMPDLQQSFGNTNFICTENVRVEDEDTNGIPDDQQADLKKQLKLLLGERFAIAKSLEDFPLPVIARNQLDDNKISQNLWYEEYVPHHSVFYFVMLASDNSDPKEWLDGKIIQFGGNASIGYGFAKLTRIAEGKGNE